MKKTKSNDIFSKKYDQQWSRMISMWPCAADDINIQKIDDVITEDNDCDFVRVMRKQVGDMTQNVQKQMQRRNNANAGPVQLPGLPLTLLLPSNDGTHFPRTIRLILMILSFLAVAIPTPRSNSELRVGLFQ